MASKAGSVITSAQKKANSTISSAAKKVNTANTNAYNANNKTNTANKTANKTVINNANKANTTAINNYKSGSDTIAKNTNTKNTGAINNYISKSDALMNGTKAENQALIDNYMQSDAYTNAQNAQNMTIQDIADKYGFDFSQEYADKQAETGAQAQRNVYNAQQRTNEATNQTALARIKDAYDSAGRSMDTNYFNQFARQQQTQANRGLNAGIAAAQNLQLGMNKQRELGDLWNQRNTDSQEESMRYANQNQTISEALAQVEKEKALNAQNIYQNLLSKGYDILSGDRNSSMQWANQNWGITQGQIGNNTDMMNAGLGTLSNATNLNVSNNNNYGNNLLNNLSNSTNMGIDNRNNYATNMVNTNNNYTNTAINNRNNYVDNYIANKNNATNQYLDTINNNTTNKLNNLNNYTNNKLNTLSDYTKMNVNDIYDQMDRAEAAAARRANPGGRPGGSPGGVQQTVLTPAANKYKQQIQAQKQTPIDKYVKGVSVMENWRKTLSPTVSRVVANNSHSIANTPTITAWDKYKMLGL